MVYFALASIWGFLAGSAAVIIAMDAINHRNGLAGELGAALVVAAILAAVGGVVVSMAYREAARRR